MVTVSEISKKAFDAVRAQIVDAIQDVTFGAETGQIVFDMQKSPGGYPTPAPNDRVETAYIEGLPSWPVEGDVVTSLGVTYYILSTRNIVKANGLYAVRLASEDNLLWKSVDIERAVKTPDGSGGYTEVWSVIATVQGGMAAMSGSERMASDRLEASSKWRLLIPYQDGLFATDRVVIDGRAYNISFVNDTQKRGTWHVLDLGEGIPT